MEEALSADLIPAPYKVSTFFYFIFIFLQLVTVRDPLGFAKVLTFFSLFNLSMVTSPLK